MKTSLIIVLLACGLFSNNVTADTTLLSQITGWGLNDGGQASGCPSGDSGITNQVMVNGHPITNGVALAGGHGHAFALQADGTIVGWGRSDSNAGEGSSSLELNSTNSLVAVGGNILRNVRSVSTWVQSVALMKDGTLVEWGGGEIQRAMPPLSNVVCISAGFENNLALTSDGRVVSWPQKLPFSLTNIVAIACTHVEWGDNVVIRKDGTIIKWNRGVGSAVSPVGLSNVIAVAAGGRGGEDLALRGDGTVIDLPYNTADWHVHSGLSNVVAIAAGGSQCMALKSDGTVAVWGDRFPYRATVPEGLSNVVAIAAGEDFCLAIQTNSVAPPK